MTGRPLLRTASLVSLLLLLCAAPAAAADLSYAGRTITISEPGAYVLADDIVDASPFICIEVRASDVVLDGNGHLVDGRDWENTAGIYVNGPAGAVRNVTVRNITVRDWYYGVYVHETDDATVESAALSSNPFAGAVVYRNATGGAVAGCTVTGSENGIVVSDRCAGTVVSGNGIGQNAYGLQVFASDGVTVTRNTVEENSKAGIRLQGAGGNTVCDNRFENLRNVEFSGDPLEVNAWSVEPRAGPNCMGGPRVGGNYWGRPDGLGFSEVTADADGDGFADAPYALDGRNADGHPLAPSVGFVPTPYTTPPTPEPTTPTPSPSLTASPTDPTPPPTPDVTPTPTTAGPGGPTNVTYTGQKITITRPGTYVLGNDIVNSTQTICIEIQASNVVFDGGGHLVDGNDTEHSAGIYVHGPTTAIWDVTIRNVRVQDWYYGVYLHDADNSRVRASTLSSNGNCGLVAYRNAVGNSITGCTVTDNQFGAVFSDGAAGGVVSDNRITRNDLGLYVFLSDGITVTRNRIRDNNESGVRFHASGGGTIYDNEFTNTVNAAFTGDPVRANAWSVTPGAAWRPPNILGGPRVGGNYWARPDGTGFSQANRDADGDGFVDAAFQVADQNLDLSPLAVYSPGPVCTGCPTAGPTGVETTAPAETGPPGTPETTTPPATTSPATSLPPTTAPPSPGGVNGSFRLEQTRPARPGGLGAVTLFMDNPYESLSTEVWLEVAWDGGILAYDSTNWTIDGFTTSETPGAGTLVLKFAGLSSGLPRGVTPVAEIAFEVLDPGVSPLGLTVLRGQSYFGPGESSLVDWTASATTRAGSFRPLVVLPGGSGYPGDPDGDGVFEDVNGNGRPDFADVVLLFGQMNWIAGNAPVPAFDYNRNGRLDFADVVVLFDHV